MSTRDDLSWPTVARDREFQRAWETLGPGAEFQGVALVGESGVGKSTLARTLADALEANRQPVRFALGTDTGHNVPLGAFSRSVNIDTAYEPAAMLAAAHRTLGAAQNLVVVVDDAQLLDPLSATLVYQLAAYREARLIVTLRSGEPVFDAVAALVKDRLLLHLPVGAFTREQTGELARRVLGGDLDDALVDDVHRRCGGNPLWLRALLRPGRETGILTRTDGGWKLHGPLHLGRELLGLVEFRLHSLTPPEREVMEVLAVAGVVDWRILRDLCGADAAASLERRGLIQLLSDGPDLVAELNHPIFGEAAMQLAGATRCRQIYGTLVQTLRRHLLAGGRSSRLPDVRGWIRLAELMIHADVELDLELLTSAAAGAAAMMNLSHAEELARFAFERGGGTPAAVELANVLGWQGRGNEAEAVFAEAVPAADTDTVDESSAVRWGCMRAANLFMGCGDTESGRRLLAEVADRAESAASVALVNALELAFAFFCGDSAPPVDTGAALCASEVSPLATMWAAVPTAHALARAGRFDEVGSVVESGLRAATHCECGPLRFTLGFAEVMALLGLGDHAAAARAVERYAEMGAASPEANAMIDAMSGMVRQTRGELTDACSAFRAAVSRLSRGYRPAWVALVASRWAQAEGMRGDAVAAATALSSAEHAFGPNAAAFESDLELARAWERAAAGQISAARAHANRAAQIAHRSGMWGVEMWTLHTAVRLGDRLPVARLAELARTLTTPWAQAIAAHARGVADHDGDLLDTTADQFFDRGAMALTADAAAQAAAEHSRTGRHGRQLKSSSRAQRLAERGGSHTPAVTTAATPLPLTARQREIAALAAAGLSNREIAERLCISVRTVDGHLYRIFNQIGIKQRLQLASLLDPPQAG